MPDGMRERRDMNACDVHARIARPSDRLAPSAWRQVLYPFPTPLPVRAGETVNLWAKHDLVNLAFAAVTPS